MDSNTGKETAHKTIMLESLCLRPKHSVQTHIMLSFGSVSFLTMAIVVVLATGFSIWAGDIVKADAEEMMRRQVISSIQDSSRLTSDVFTERFITLRGIAAVMTEIVRDRIVGYPDQGYEDDRHVPFLDIDRGVPMYPLETQLLPLDWNISRNLLHLEGDNHLTEHLQGARANFFTQRDLLGRLSTSTPSFFFPGVCNPNETDASGDGYLEGCTVDSNDLETTPVETTQWLARKSADIGVLLKPLWETTEQALTLNVYFHNSGFGAEVNFPGFVKSGNDTYKSIGCEWMRARNPYTKTRFASNQEIAMCNPAGTQVSYRQFNPMEHEFCRDQATHPGETRVYGPFRSTELDDWFLIAGMAVFDRMTGQFIACTGVVASVSTFEAFLQDSIVGEYTEAALVRNDGTVVAGAGWDSEVSQKTIHVADTSFLDSDTFEALVKVEDWEKEWDSIAGRIEDFNDRVLSAYPIPPMPEEYDPHYRPDFYAVFSIGGAVFDVVDEVEKSIDDEVSDLIVFSIWVAIVGLCAFLLVVVVVSWSLTQPLLWIERVTSRIVRGDDSLHTQPVLNMLCSPRTEIGDLVAEFEKMIGGFSGDGASTVVSPPLHELGNDIGWKKEFASFYAARRTQVNRDAPPDFDLGPEDNPQTPDEDYDDVYDDDKDEDADRSAEKNRVNLGSHLPLKGLPQASERAAASIPPYRSNLFASLVCLITTPLLMASIAICGVVSSELRESLPDLIDISEDLSFQLELDSLVAASQLRSSFSSSIFQEPIRNAFVLSRVAGWLLFDGISRSNGFTNVEISFIEECKAYASDDSCPFFQDPTRSTCDCSWNDPAWPCTNFTEGESRFYQKMVWIGQNLPGDTDPFTGNRYSSNIYPESSYSPETTNWWDDVSTMPGSDKGSNASGYETIYDRTRVISATSVIQFPIYNYVNIAKNVNERLSINSLFVSEAAGVMMGYSGCGWGLTHMNHFQITEGNSAGTNRRELCPVEKYGFDPRCRGWYATELDATGPMTILPSFQFSEDDRGFGSVGTSLQDPRNGEYIGQTILDFAPLGLSESLRVKTSSYWYFLISPESVNGGDTVIAGNYTPSGVPEPIADIALPYDAPGTARREAFDAIVKKMKGGESGDELVLRTLADGTTQEVWLAYSPVEGRMLKSSRPDDFSRGANSSEAILYSLGIMRLKGQMKQAFTDTQANTNDTLEIITLLFPLLIVVVALASLLATMQISLYIASPIITLLRAVRNFNDGNIEEDVPKSLPGGSIEEHEILESFSKVYNLVRISNNAFFKGDLEWVYSTTKAAHDLCLKVRDEKASGVTSNNLGITLLALYREHYSLRGSCFKKVDDRCCAELAISYFNNAVRIAEDECQRVNYDREPGEVDDRMDYAEQLANRYFNRALFYFVCPSDPCCPENARQLGVNDLQKAKELDGLASQSWVQGKMLVAKSESYFNRLIHRIHGLASLRFIDKRVFDDGWDGLEVVEEAAHLLSTIWRVQEATIFNKLTRVGRMQQLEAAIIRCKLACNQDTLAMQMGIRMLVEDQHILQPSFAASLEAISRDMRFGPDSATRWCADSLKSTHEEMDAILENFDKSRIGNSAETVITRQKRIFFCVEVGEEQFCSATPLDTIRFYIARLYDHYCSPDDVVGFATNEIGPGHPLHCKMFPKKTHQDEHVDIIRQMFTKANSSAGKEQSLAVGFQACMQSSILESYVVLVTDGSPWDKRYKSYATTMKSVVSRQNRTLGGRHSLHVIVVGLDLDSVETCEGYKSFTLVNSEQSAFINTTEDDLEEAFDQVSHLISNRDSRASNNLQLGTTWEKF